MKEQAIKLSLFKLWKAVEDGTYNTRSIVGDEALNMRDNLYDNEGDFWKEYGSWKETGKATFAPRANHPVLAKLGLNQGDRVVTYSYRFYGEKGTLRSWNEHGCHIEQGDGRTLFCPHNSLRKL